MPDNTPDTEMPTREEILATNKRLEKAQNEYLSMTTPDTEWEGSEAKKRVDMVESIAMVHGVGDYTGETIPEFINRIVASRDTYWKERVDKYNELILAVGNKHEGETRHETALRYIKQAEQPHGEATATPITNEDNLK